MDGDGFGEGFVGGDGLAGEEKGRRGDCDDGQGENEADWNSLGLGRGNCGSIGSLGKFDAEFIGTAGAGVVFGEALAEAIEDFAAEDVFLDLGGLAVEVGFDGELEVLGEGGGIAHWIDFNDKIISAHSLT